MPEAQPQKGHRAAWTGAAAETMAQPRPAPTAAKAYKAEYRFLTSDSPLATACSAAP